MEFLRVVFAYLAIATLVLAKGPMSPENFFRHPGKKIGWLPIQLELKGNTLIKATVHNTEYKEVKVFNIGTFLDPSPVQKARVFTKAGDVTFQGIDYSLKVGNLPDSAFDILPAWDTKTVEFDLAEIYDLSAGEEYHVIMAGELPISNYGNELTDWIPYMSTTLTMKVNATQAAADHASKRFEVTKLDSCKNTKLAAVSLAFENCGQIAAKAAKAARSAPDALLKEYFKKADRSVRWRVKGLFHKLAEGCEARNATGSQVSCDDLFCNPERKGAVVSAWTSGDHINYCDAYFDAPATTDDCHNVRKNFGEKYKEEHWSYPYHDNQVGTTIHEMTRLRTIWGTRNYAYGYDRIQKLAWHKNLEDADTYEYFANAVENSCNHGK